MNYRDDLDDFKLNSHLDNEEDWRRYPTNSAYKKSAGDHKRSSYSDTDHHLDLSPEHRSKSYDKAYDKTFDKTFDKQFDKTYDKSADELSRTLDKKYDLYNSTNYKDNFNENYKDSSYKEISYKEPLKESSFFKDPYKEPFKETYKDPYKDPYKDAFKENELSKAPDRKYNDKKFSSASENSDYRAPERSFERSTDRNLEFDFGDTEKKSLAKRPSNPYDAGKASELRKVDYRRSSDLRKSLDKFDLLENSAPSKITIDLSKDRSDRYRSSLDDGRPDEGRSKGRFNLDDYFPTNSDTDAGGAREKTSYRKNSDFDKYSTDSLTNAVKGKFDKYDKYAGRNLERSIERNLERNLDKQYDFGDGILDEIRRMELKEEVRENEIMSELKNAENILKPQNNHKFLHKADSLGNQIKIPSNLAKTSSKFFC